MINLAVYVQDRFNSGMPKAYTDNANEYVTKLLASDNRLSEWSSLDAC